MFVSPKKSPSPLKVKQKSFDKNDKKCLCNFSNGIYQGLLNFNSFEGENILMMDDGIFYIGEMQNDQLHGKGLLVFPSGGYYLGVFFENKMNGKGSIYYTDGRVINGTFKQSKLLGKYSFFDPDVKKWYECSADDYKITSETSCFSNTWQNIQEIFKPNHLSKTKTMISIITKEEKIYVGCVKNNQPQGLGLWIGNTHSIIEYGEYKIGLLNGLGKKFERDLSFYDGNFEKGERSGLGVYFSEITSCFIYGMFNKGDVEKVLEKGRNFPIDIVLLMKKNMHFISNEKTVELFHMGLDMKFFGEMFYMQDEEMTNNELDENKKTTSNEIKENQMKKINFEENANILKQEGQRKLQVFNFLSITSNSIFCLDQ